MMINKIDEIFTKYVFSVFYLISFGEKNLLGASFFVFSLVSGIGAYLCFNPPYENYNYSTLTFLLGKSTVGWIQLSVSIILMVAGLIATYKAFYPAKPIDYAQYLYPISKSDRVEITKKSL